MIDAHCHLVDNHYSENEVPDIISRAKEAGVTAMISNGTSIENTKKTIALAEKFPEVWATVGIHPDERDDYLNNKSEAVSLLCKMAKHPKVVAIGEAALDFKTGISIEEKKLQQEMFAVLLQVACETELPLVVHNRNADKEILSFLAKFKGNVQLHCFVESWEFAMNAISRNYYLSFGGIVTFKKSENLRDIVKRVPDENILLETDAPYLAPEPVRDSINTPANVKIVAEMVAKIRNTTTEQTELTTENNTRRLFMKMTN
jgi:TatD DNase family protein